MNSFKGEDKNTTFCHVEVHMRINVGSIFMLHHDDQVISHPNMIEDSIMSFILIYMLLLLILLFLLPLCSLLLLLVFLV